jgi:hypothetical protein
MVERTAIAAFGKSGGFLALDWGDGSRLEPLAAQFWPACMPSFPIRSVALKLSRLTTYGGPFGADGGPAGRGGGLDCCERNLVGSSARPLYRLSQGRSAPAWRSTPWPSGHLEASTEAFCKALAARRSLIT